jgi:hypothetical protein
MIEDADLIRDIDKNILNTFRYPESVLAKVKEEFKQTIDQLSSIKNVEPKKYFKESLEIFISKIKDKFISKGKKELVYYIFLRAVKITLNKNKILTEEQFKDRYNFNFESIISFTFKDWGLNFYKYSNLNKKDGFRNVFIDLFDFPSNLNDLEKDKFMKRIFIILNNTFQSVYALLEKYFMEDMTHKYRLDEIVHYQKKVEGVFDKISKRRGLDTTRTLMKGVRQLLSLLKIDDFDIDVQDALGKSSTMKKEFGRGEYPIRAILDKTSDYFNESNVLRKLESGVEYALDNEGIQYEKNYLDKGVYFEIKQGSQISKRDIQRLLKNEINAFLGSRKAKRIYIRNITTTNIEIGWDYRDIFADISKNGFKMRSIGQMLKKKQGEFEIKLELWKGEIEDEEGKKKEKKLIEPIQLIDIIDGKYKTRFRVFDLIKYFEDLCFELHDFFIRDLNLKAILQRRKYTERWDGTRGYLDIGATVRQSLRRGWIQPQQTYRKKQTEDPPLIFVNYDISGSMGGVVRTSQFLIYIILSFFDKDIRKWWIGYIGKPKRDQEGEMFPSDNLIETERWAQKREKFDLSQAYRHIKEEAIHSLSYSYFGQISNSYYDYEYETALRDFLDCHLAGTTNSTRMDCFHLMTNHPDMDMRGLKYVFLVTDAVVGSKQKMDIVRIGRALLERTDVRFFFLWIISPKSLAQSPQTSLIPDDKYHFITKIQIARILHYLTWDESEKRYKTYFEDENERYEVEFYKFVYDNWDNCYIVTPTDLRYVGEIKHILKKLEEIDFFIP